MNPDKSLQNLFCEALERDDPVERVRFLDDACGADAALRERVENLLRAREEIGAFMAQPSRKPAGLELNPTGRVVLPLTEKPGDKIGRYKLLQQIGEGGCGVVYMAEQEEPVRRRVALKVIKLGMDTKQVIARFEAERQALALMDHPTIAKVLDAGATDTGRPYFVMELVRGTKITEFCDENKLATEDRLKLFIQVCQAIQHAHQKGVIHRDIKPSNILVTVNDGVPVPKVIDFGIAKATQGRLTDQTLFTAFEQFIGTPAYMSPEQAVLTSLDIDTRSDIYSLGVLLYELLTGGPPFDQKELLAAGLDGMRRTIREVEPLRPSNRLITMVAEALTETALHRHTEPPKLVHAVRGDLDWIAMKCLEKDRARRYETANALAADIRRHLESEPVVARPPSRLYEFQKTVRRHKFGFAATAAVVVALAAGLGIASWTLIKERQAKMRAVAAEESQSRLREEAQRSALQAEQEAKRAEQNATDAQEQRQKAEALAEKNRLNLYAARTKLAAQAIAEGDVPLAQELLESLRPQKDEEDLRSFDWYYLVQLASNEKVALSGVGGRVRSVAYSPDGRFLAAASDDKTIRLWDAKTQELRAQLKGHTREIACIAFAPDGQTLASAGAEGAVRIWSVASFKQLHLLQADTNGLSSLAFSPDGNTLAVGEGGMGRASGSPFERYARPSQSGRVLLWNAKSLKIERILAGHSNGTLSLAFSADGKQLATSGFDRALALFDATTGQRLFVQTNFSGLVFAILFLPNNELAAASWNPYLDTGRITIFDVANLEQKRVMFRAGKVTCLALSPDGSTLASAGPDRILRLRNVDAGQESGVYQGHEAAISSIAFSPDGQFAATASLDDTVRVWDLKDPAHQSISKDSAYSVAFSPDGTLLASSSRTVQIHDAATGNMLRTLGDYTDGDVRVIFSPDGSTLAATGDNDEVHFWNVRTWKHWSPRKEDQAPYRAGDKMPVDSQFAFSPDSRTLARGDRDGSILLWDVETGKATGTINHRGVSVAYTPDGTRLVSVTREELRVWNTSSRRVESLVPESGDLLRISKDGRWLALGRAGRISIRELPSLAEVRALRVHRDTVWGLDISHDGKILATGSWDGTVKLWQVATGQELFTIPSIGVVWSVAFSPDDRTLAFAASGYSIGELTILRCASPEKIARQTRELGLRNAASLVKKCDELAAAGDWKGALETVNELLRLEPGNDYHHFRLALLLVAVRDLEGYRQAIQRIQTQFGDIKDTFAGERLVVASVILPASGVDLETVTKWTDVALARNKDRWNDFVKGLSEYRQGNFADAARSLETAAKKVITPAIKAETWTLLAMVRWQLRQPDAARAALASGVKIIEEQHARTGDTFRYAPNNWTLWIGADALYREASLLIDGKAPPDPFKANRE